MLDWTNIQTVLLDMDGTLLDLHFDNFFWMEHVPRCYADTHEVPIEQARDRLHEEFRAFHGKLEFYCIDFWSNRLAIDIEREKDALSTRICFLPHATLLLEQLQRSDMQSLIVTNAHRKTFEIKDQKLQLSVRVDDVIVSHELDYAKEDAGFWEALQGSVDFDPTRTLLVDDNEAVLEAAASHGIQHLVIPRNPDSTRPGQAIRNPGKFIEIDSLAQVLPHGDQ